MTEQLIKKYKKNYKELQKHIYRLEKAYNKLLEKGFKFDLNIDDIEKILENDDLVLIIDQIVYRFSKLQDTIGKILRLYFLLKGESVENLSTIDLINLAEKRGIEINKEKWFQLRELRNIIAHEYEDEYEEIAKLLNKIYKEKNFLKNLVEQLKDF